MTCGERIQEMRLKKKLSAEQLAREVGVSCETVTGWESGTSLPESGKLLVLAAVLGTSADYLQYGTVKNTDNKADNHRKLGMLFYVGAISLYFIGLGTGEFSRMATVFGISLLYYGTSPLAIGLLMGAAACLILGIMCTVNSHKKYK